MALLGYPQGPLLKIARFQAPSPPLDMAVAMVEWLLNMRGEQRVLSQEGPDLSELVHDDVQAVPLHVQRLRLVSRLQNLEWQVH